MTVERRVYTKEFKEQVVMLIETSGKSVSEIAKDLGIRENNLLRWKKGISVMADITHEKFGSLLLKHQKLKKCVYPMEFYLLQNLSFCKY
ncbi:MAG TPA: transposase [Bacillota bacterium]|nr:transposase [Bacillota bacterium]